MWLCDSHRVRWWQYEPPAGRTSRSSTVPGDPDGASAAPAPSPGGLLVSAGGAVSLARDAASVLGGAAVRLSASAEPSLTEVGGSRSAGATRRASSGESMLVRCPPPHAAAAAI